MSEIKKANIELHKREAPFYEQVHFEIFNEAEQKYVDETLSKLWRELKSKKICLDMGCGTGNITRREIKFFDWAIGIDLSRSMLLQFKKRTKSKNLFLVCCDCENLPFKDNTFDFISMYSTLHHLPQPFSALREMFRVLKIEGVTYIAHEPNGLKTRLFLGTFSNIIFKLGRFVTRKSSKYPLLVSCQRKLGSRADIYAQSGFSPQNIKIVLRHIGFSKTNVVYHDLLPVLTVFPKPFNRLVDHVYLLEKNKIVEPFCSSIVILAKK